ncbi:anaphase promoting complex subunit 11 [Chrysochromulina tobinii]|uniref:Anaphase-promoting complex subunit 11 n=1 Tax=Chrysochromulina tobinii TaxID=1460289 RepID=A0A0M0K5L1_9EUKA|nr:anaphase promoting complex subunit 11 [Chrysochromulina tobinii]|eukprot:KOO34105.1 anaphase promoting complex subunit 11 [Chrysochromulina sp. CCMP291]
MPPASCGTNCGMKVTIKNWHAVASWTWTTEDDVCGICHMPLDGCAPGAAGPGDDSPVVWGRCSHYFHLMCITTWLHNKNTCPICRRKWEFASAPKPAPATPGTRRHGEGFAVAEAAAPVED